MEFQNKTAIITGGTSGILNAPSPAERVRDMAVAMVKAAKELEEEK